MPRNQENNTTGHNEFYHKDQNEWILRFFVRTDYEQNILVTRQNTLPNNTISLSSMAMIISNQFNDDIAEKLSKHIRGSYAIKCNDFKTYSSHSEHIDGKGFSFFSKHPGQATQFHKRIILYALAFAYLSAIEMISTKLAQETNQSDCNISALNTLYLNVTKFYATFLYHQPVLVQRTSLTETWKYIDSVLNINRSANELITQLSSIHYILNLTAEQQRATALKEKQARQEKWNLIFAVIGILIAVIEIFT